MKKNTQNLNLLLTFSIFKKLYDEKKDIYQIIALFIKRELSNSGLIKFSLTEITHRINKEYQFDIPQAVVKISLNKLKREGSLKLEQHKYIKLENFEDENIIYEDSGLAAQQEKYIIETFKSYISKDELSDDDIQRSLEHYILSRNDEHDIFPIINSCIIKNQQNDQFINGLNKIRYGLILYEGIACGIENINPDNWNSKVIFLDTEILFYLGSCNGELFNKIASDFISLIKIVNKTKEIVKLVFSEDVKKEADSFFYIAEAIIRNETVANKANDVLINILKNCTSPSDVLSKKSEFYLLLSGFGIKEYDPQLRYHESNFEYNLEYDSDLGETEQKHLRQVSFINMLRSGHKCLTLDHVKFILLTETRNTIDLSKKHKDKEDFPLALSLFDLTNQLWIKTNKGLGNKELPSTFDIRNKAKIALSSSLAKKVSKEFDKVNNDYKNKKIDENLFIDKIADLKKIDSTPDGITEENCEVIRNLIVDPSSMKMHYEEKAFYKQESEKKDDVIRIKDDEIRDLKKQKEEKIELAKKEEENRKYIMKLIKKGFLCILAILFLWYFSDYLNLLKDKFYYAVTIALPMLAFFGVDMLKINSWYKNLMNNPNKLTLFKFKK